MKKQAQDQIVLRSINPEGQQKLRSCIKLGDSHELTAFRAVNRCDHPLVYTIAPRGLMADVESLLGAYESLMAVYWRDRR